MIMSILGKHDFPNKITRVLVEKILKEKGFTKVFYKVSPASADGDNYFGYLFYVHIKGKRYGRHEIINFIVKLAPTELDFRESVPIADFYMREIYAYTKVLKSYHEIQDSVPNNSYKFQYAKCYGYNAEPCKEMLVLQDLKANNFIMYNRLKSIDLDHASIAIKSLARLHALSFIMKHQKPKLYAEISREVKEVCLVSNPRRPHLKNFYHLAVERAVRAIRNPVHRQKLERFLVSPYDKLVEALAVDKFSIICHGDFWINNILFKYKNGVPVDIRVLDYQVMREASPVTDIFYFLFSCTDQAFRRNHYEEILELYFIELEDYLKNFSLDIKRIFPKQEFLNEFKRKSAFGIVMVTVVLLFFTNDSGNLPGAREIRNGDYVNIDAFVVGKSKERYEERIRGVVHDFVTYGYL